MRIVGIGDIPSVKPNSHHPNRHAFAHPTAVSIQDILLSNYTNNHRPSSVSHSKLHALVHYVTVNHYAEAIVLTCRGTLGLGDVLTDLTCDYKEFTLPADYAVHYDGGHKRTYVAHGDMLEAVQLLAAQGYKKGARKLPSLWPCTLFLDSFAAAPGLSGLTAGRPIHYYIYGSPCVMSLSLSEYCGQGLVTSVIDAFDIVSGLSLGLLKGFKNTAVSLHGESHVTDEISSHIIDHYQQGRKDLAASVSKNKPLTTAATTSHKEEEDQ
ncbi:hypothetical protein [Parasitella parasitica]|uniref:Uncharacterized protein n=1 Tax=Parasitella parasitica TaxID=35722 RepID=A0A0B7NCN6_9FUNG|nr:hypothetical protein [Parasitella parasitica]